MIVELALGGGILALMLMGGGGSEVSDEDRNALWNALCGQWKNGANPPDALGNAIAAAGLDETTTTANLAMELWESIAQRSGGDRTLCPVPPWTQVTGVTGELTPPKPPKPGGINPAPVGPLFPPPGNGALGVYQSYLDAAPGADSILQVTKANGGGGLSGVAHDIVAALGAEQSSTNRVTVMKALSLSKWNLPYRMPHAPKYWTVTRDGLTWDVRGAFFPANVDVATAVAQGQLPRRNIAWKTSVQKTGDGSSYGALYVPDFAVFDGKVIPPSNDDEGAAGMVPDSLLGALGVTPDDITP